MKSKKFLSLASVLLGATLFTACTGDYKMQFFDYWNYNAEVPVTGEKVIEELSYKVTHSDYEPGSGLVGDTYSLQYTNGVYTTKLSTKQEGDKTYYLYETNLTIDVIYTCNGVSGETLSDSVSSWVKFEKGANKLQPIASHKELVSHSPVNGTATKPENCYQKYDYTVDVTYASDLSEGTATVTNRAENDPDENPFEIERDDYDYLDNEQLLIALRAIEPSTSTTPTFLVYSPFAKAVQKIKASFASAEGLDVNFTRNSNPVTGAINAREVTLSIDATNPGSSQSVWIAEKVSSMQNTNRNVILKMSVPVSYNLGNLVYELQSANYPEA